tara:strand:+ start:336 stop:1046 length:711 start_codon:yes stop_codon:yes gene_type:complete
MVNSKIVRTYVHPGLPRIDVVQKLRTSVQREMQKVDKTAFAVYDVADYQVEQGPRTFIGREASTDGMMGFAAYFDKAAYTQLIDDISRQMYDKGDKQLREILVRATEMAKNEIKNRKRAFKSKIKSTARSDGDIYDSLADSLGFSELEEADRKRGRYQRYVAGSYDIRGVGGAVIPESGFRGEPAANQPTGFFGSRMADSPSNKSLTEIYRRGQRRSRKITTRLSAPAKRLKGHFK